MRTVFICVLCLMSCGIISAQDNLHNKIEYQGEFVLSGCAVVQKATQGYATSLETTHGILYNKVAFCGLGTGVLCSFTNTEVSLPVYAEGRYYFSDANCKPFIDLKMGGVFCLERQDNAFLVASSVGFSIRSLLMKFGYQYNAGVSTEWNGKMYSNYNYDLNSLYLSVGFSF